MIAAFFAGLLMSCVGSIPPTGPIALIVLRLGLLGRNASAVCVACGAALAESAYASCAYIGINYVLAHCSVRWLIMRLLAGSILLGFAAACRTGRSRVRLENKRLEGKFLLGLGIAGLNPTFIVTWAGSITIVRSMGLVLEIRAAPAFAIGALLGPILWFCILLRILSGTAGRIPSKTLDAIERMFPVVMSALAGGIFIHALMQFLSSRLR